jgi:putative flippase GtrA
MTKHFKLIFFYTLFALIAIAVNLGTQKGVIELLSALGIGLDTLRIPLFSGPWNMLVGMGCGTLTGLMIKYVLDKRYIFNFTTQNIKHDSQLFFLYSIMGLVTTALFYLTQLLFYTLFGTQAAFYTGGAIGLSAGYWIKYLLDKRFVFTQTGNHQNA